MLLGSQARHATPLNIIGKLLCFLRRSHLAAFTARKGCFRSIDRYQDFQSPPLTLLPQGQCFLHRVFLAAKSSALNGLADERFLIGGELHFHTFSA